MSRRQINFKGRTTGDILDLPAVSPSGEATLYYDTATSALMVSINGGAYAVVESSGALGDTLVIGGDVTLARVGANILSVPTVQFADGTQLLPGMTFVTDPDTGIYRHGANILSLTTGGARGLSVDASQRVGIGTVTPTQGRLQVEQAVGTAAISINATGSGKSGLAFGGGAYGFFDYDTGGADGLRISALAATPILLGHNTSAAYGASTFTEVLRITAAALTFTEAANIVTGTTTGTSLGAAANQKVGMHGAAVVQVAGTVQTYATADGTHAAPTAAALTVTDGAGTNDGTIGAITADASVIAAVQELADQINKLVADDADTKQFLNFVVDGLQLKGIFA